MPQGKWKLEVNLLSLSLIRTFFINEFLWLYLPKISSVRTMSNSQHLSNIQVIIDDAVRKFGQTRSITNRNTLPVNGRYPIVEWLKIPDVICVYVDIRNSTWLSAISHSKSTAWIYELFTETAVRIFHEFESSYIDIKGDGVFALFNAWEEHRALVAAVSFKTFASEVFQPLIKKKIPSLDLWFHMWIDQSWVLVKQIWLRDKSGRDSRKNEVWAWKPVNMAAKLASRSPDKQLWVSERFFWKLNSELVLKSCWCRGGEQGFEKVWVWKEEVVAEDDIFDFKKIFILNPVWCKTHGAQWCKNVLTL